MNMRSQLSIVAGWSGLFALSAAAGSPGAAGALQQPVTLPLWTVLLVTLTPTSSFAQLAQSVVKGFDQRFAGGA